MTVIGVTMVRDEADVIGFLLEHMLSEGVDHVIVADNLSTDNTRGICESFAEVYPVTVIDDTEPGYYQADKMTDLAAMAYGMGADWVVPFDADEIWYSPDGRRFAHVLEDCDADIVVARAFDHIARDADPDWVNPFLRIQWRRTYPQKMGKVAFRAHADAALHMGNHDVDLPGDPTKVDLLELRHFQYRSLEHMARKTRQGTQAYDAAPDLHGMYGTHWKNLAALDDPELADEWRVLQGEGGLVHDPAPWRSF